MREGLCSELFKKENCALEESGTVIVVEDDPSIADLLNGYLRKEGYRVLLASDGTRGLELFSTNRACMLILDISLPGELDGLDVCREVRKTSAVPIIMLTARDTELDKILGLELGADDYVTKPFSPRELLSRIRAILRRTAAPSKTQSEDEIIVSGVTLNFRTREVYVAGKPIPFTTREFELLAYFFQNRRVALSRRQLLDGVWGPDWYGDDRTVDVHVRQLRKKLGSSFPLVTVWGIGYRMD